MKYLILGCNGMVGHLVSIYLKEENNEVIGYARGASKFIETIIGDVLDFDKLSNVIENGNFDFIINCVGVLNQFAEDDKCNAILLNALVPHKLVEITKDLKTRIIHISTDCVFSGKKGNYTEDDFPDGTTFYDRTKALGEIFDDKNITIRTSVVGPDTKENGIGLLNWFMKQKKEISGYDKTFWTGVTTLELAKIIKYVSKTDLTGLYNVVPSYKISKKDLLVVFNKYFKGGRQIINTIDGIDSDKSLISIKKDLKYSVSDYDKMIRELSEWVKNHPDIYPEYYFVHCFSNAEER